MGVVNFRTPTHGVEVGNFFCNQGQIGQLLSEEISLLKCSSRLGKYHAKNYLVYKILESIFILHILDP